MGRLTALGVRNAATGRHGDGDGLYLVVKPTGAKSWVLRVQVDGRRRDVGLGSIAARKTTNIAIEAGITRRHSNNPKRRMNYLKHERISRSRERLWQQAGHWWGGSAPLYL